MVICIVFSDLKKTVDMSFETKNFDLGIQLVIDIPDEFWNKFRLLT